MIAQIKTLVNVSLFKLLHPTIKTNGIHHIRLRTEIILQENGKLELGNRVSTHKRVTFSVVGGHLRIGSNTSFNRNDIIVCHNIIKIGENCSFGPNVVVYDHDHKFSIEGSEKCKYNTTPIIIEDNCWLGANVTILRGTHIGEGCVIGAGTIVKGEIPPHSLVTSNREMLIKPIEDMI